MKRRFEKGHDNKLENATNNKNVTQKAQQEWRKVMNSTEEKLSEGAQEAFKLRTVAHKDQWRRDNKKSK